MLVFLGLACSPKKDMTPSTISHDVSTELAVLTPSFSALMDFQATVTLHNLGGQPLRVNTYTLQSATLNLQIQDAKGQPVYHLPPPTPDSIAYAAGWKELGKDESYSVHYHDLAVSESALPSGSYRLRFVGQVEYNGQKATCESKWVDFTRE